MTGKVKIAAVAVACAALASPSASAQGGYTTEKRPDLGMDFPRARDFIAVPNCVTPNCVTRGTAPPNKPKCLK